MAAQNFTPVTVGARTATAKLVVQAATTIASKTTYTPVTVDGINTVAYSWVTYDLVYVKGDETSLRGYIGLYNGTDWVPASRKETPSGGYAPLGIDYFEITGTQTFSTPPIQVSTKQRVNIYLVANGGTPTGTIAVSANGGIDITAFGA